MTHTGWFRMIIALAAAMTLFACALAENGSEPKTENDGWQYAGYIYGGITFAIPGDYMDFGVSDADAARGCIMIGGNEKFILQLRCFDPAAIDYAYFKAIIQQEPSSDWSVRMDGDLEILTYRNTAPGPSSELYGIAMTGLDGKLYKISIFTGADEAFGEDAPVWEIAERIAESARHQDFSEWGLESPNTSEEQ